MPRFAVILSGSGRADGSEIHEAVTALLAIDKAGCTSQCFAPNIEQAAVINHLTSEKTDERRNVLVESARIARGNIKPLDDFKAKDFDCIIFPGGLGAITNWCDFAISGVACTVDNSIKRVLLEAYKENLVIGAMCIAPVIIAKVLGEYGITVTIGNDKTIAEKIKETGAKHQNTDAKSACVDEENMVVTTPAYMLANSISEVAAGAENMVQEMVRLAKSEAE
ncbi:MAG: isoprenoid biosynthesis glyoxalase ElbB [Alphaproteobacteria bacterium]|nr:isoprenoid biosynthesis glyoxalase ElbB [Alphaproteobacteria bacterium]